MGLADVLRVVQIGTNVTLSITVNEPLYAPPQVIIANDNPRAAVFISSSGSDLLYSAWHVMVAGDLPNPGPVSLRVSVVDRAGNAFFVTAITSGSNVTFGMFMLI